MPSCPGEKGHISFVTWQQLSYSSFFTPATDHNSYKYTTITDNKTFIFNTQDPNLSNGLQGCEGLVLQTNCVIPSPPPIPAATSYLDNTHNGHFRLFNIFNRSVLYHLLTHTQLQSPVCAPKPPIPPKPSAITITHLHLPL